MKFKTLILFFSDVILAGYFECHAQSPYGDKARTIPGTSEVKDLDEYDLNWIEFIPANHKYVNFAQ
jgi:hypothetical protein